MKARPLKERLDTWFNYNYGMITRYLIHPDDLKEARDMDMEYDGLPIQVLGVNYGEKAE